MVRVCRCKETSWMKRKILLLFRFSTPEIQRALLVHSLSNKLWNAKKERTGKALLCLLSYFPSASFVMNIMMKIKKKSGTRGSFKCIITCAAHKKFLRHFVHKTEKKAGEDEVALHVSVADFRCYKSFQPLRCEMLCCWLNTFLTEFKVEQFTVIKIKRFQLFPF